MKATFRPCTLSGTINAPPSKSMAHRYLICAALADGESVTGNIVMSADISATIDCLNAMGADIKSDKNTAYVHGIKDFDIKNPLNCRESGSTLRFLIPMALRSEKNISFCGAERLFARPLEIYEDIAKENGYLFKPYKNGLDLCGKLRSGEYTLRGDISSQFISGLLFSLPLADGDSIINILPPFESRSYVDLTLDAMKTYGVTAEFDGEYTIKIKGNQKYTPKNCDVEGDYSNAALIAAYNCAGGSIELTGLKPDSLQGDRVYADYFRQLMNDENPVLDISDCPDLGPVLFAAAAISGGAVFTGTRRLAIKESDRAAAMAQELKKMGIETVIEENTVSIKKGTLTAPSEPLLGHNDHRIVMALCVLLSITGGSIDGAEAVSKSFPDYFEVIKKLNAEVTLE